MTQKIIIIGSGFAGFWASASAARAVALAHKVDEVEVILISPAPRLVIRPRLYEAILENMTPDLTHLLEAIGVRHVAGWVEAIDCDARAIDVSTIDGSRQTLVYDRLVVATGSELVRPAVPGLAEHGFDTDQLEAAYVLDDHIKSLATAPESLARNTVVIAGGGLTGLETATEMPIRLRASLGRDASVRVILVDSSPQIGVAMGLEALMFIEEALAETGVECRAGVRVTAIGADNVTLSSGEVIETRSLVWTAGLRANKLAAQLPGHHDAMGRVIADAFLHAPEANGVFVTGDIVKVPTDEDGNFNVMSCQHAMSLGRVAGHNAAAELVGLPLHPYSQPRYVTCLDLGGWGALFTEGWDRQVRLTREAGKAVKRAINTMRIYPPDADRDAIFAQAEPGFGITS